MKSMLYYIVGKECLLRRCNLDIQVLSLSSKGQIVLPMAMRRSLELKTGSKLAAYVENGCILIKPIVMPTKNDFKNALKKTQEWAKSVDFTEDDLESVLKEIRKEIREEGNPK